MTDNGSCRGGGEKLQQEWFQKRMVGDEMGTVRIDNFFKKFSCVGEHRNGVATGGESGANSFLFIMGDVIAGLWEQPSNEETFSDLGVIGDIS